MELNKIKLFDKAELLEKLKQNGFTEVVGILEDKEINGEKLIELREFEIFKWKLSATEKKYLWDCIKEIKEKPYMLLKKEKPRVPKKNNLRRSSSFSQDQESTNSFKGKLECLLGTSAASTGSASTLPNKNNTNFNNANKTAESNFPRNKPLPPPPNDPQGNQKQIQKIIKKPALPLPEKANDKNGGSGHLKSGSPPKSNFSDTTETYMDMQPPTNKKKMDEDGGYLTPSEVSPATNFKNSVRLNTKNNTFSKRNSEKNISAPRPPPLPKNINAPKRNISKEQKSWNSGQRNVPKTENQEEEDTYEPPPRIGNVPRIPNFPRKGNQNKDNISDLNRKPEISAGANRNVINTNKFAVEVVTDETEDSYEVVDNGGKRPLKKINNSKQVMKDDESDDIYETPPAVKPKMITNNNTRGTEMNKTNKPTDIGDSAVETEPTNAKKLTIKDLENVVILNEKETQGAVLTKFTSSLSNFFRVKRSKDAYENHSIIPSERRESVIMPTNNRPLPEIPNETDEQNREARPTDTLFSKPFPPPRKMVPVPDPPGEYVKLIPKNALNESPPPFTIKQQDDEFEEGQTYSNVTETATKENIPHFSTGRRQKLKDTESNTSYVSNNEVDEEIADYENTNKHSVPAPRNSTHTNQLASLLANELRKRNLLVKEDSQSTFEDDESDFEDEDSDQPAYVNTTPNSNISTSQGKNNISPNLSSSKNMSPTPNVARIDKYDDDLDQPFYGNNITPIRSTPIQRQIHLSPNSLPHRNNSPTRNTSRVDTDDDDDDDLNQPVYGNSPTPIRSTAIERNNDLSPNPIPFGSNSPRRNISRVNKKKSHVDDDSSDDDSHNNYGNIPETSNQLSFKNNSPRRNISIVDKKNRVDDGDFDDDSPNYGNIPEATNPLIPNINTNNQRKNNLYPNSLPLSKILPSTSISPSVRNKKPKDADSYDRVEEKTPIYRWPLPDIPKKSNIPAIKNFTSNTRSPIKNSDVHTPSSSGEEDIDDDNITYGNVDESIPKFKRPPPITSNKHLSMKSKKADDTINHPPKPAIRLNYEHYMGKKGKEEQVTVSEEKQDKDYNDSIFNINDEPYYRNTDRKGAKLLLQNLENGAFLFRPSYSHPTHFLVLTIKHQGKFYNLGIERSSKNKIRLNAEGGSMAPEFGSMKDFINYFKKEPITFEGNKGVIVEIYLNPVLPPSSF